MTYDAFVRYVTGQRESRWKLKQKNGQDEVIRDKVARIKRWTLATPPLIPRNFSRPPYPALIMTGPLELNFDTVYLFQIGFCLSRITKHYTDS